MNDKPKNALSSVLSENATVVIRDDASRGGLGPGEVLAWRRWFDEHRRKLASSGGRPTNPNWAVKRQVSFSAEVWDYLEKRAAVCSESGPRIGPGQVAGFLVEDAVQNQARAAVSEEQETLILDAELQSISSDGRFREWTMPALFSGATK